MPMTVGDLRAILRLDMKSFESELRKAQKLGDAFTKQFSKPISSKGLFANITKDANAASKQAAQQIQNNLKGATKGIDTNGLKAALNFKIDAGPLNSITTGINGISIAAGLAASAVGAMASALASGMSAVVSNGMAFEQQMSAVAAISFAGQDMGSAEVQSAFKALEDQAISLGSSTTFTAEQVGSAQELLARAGFSVQETIAATPGLLSAAAAEGLGLAATADIAASALRGFGLEAGQMNMVADVLAQTSASSNASITGLGESFKYIAPVAQAVGLELTDVSAALGLLANMGIQGSMAGRNLASGIMSLTKPSAEAKVLMQQLGISVVDASGNFKALPEIFANIEQATMGMGEAQKLATIQTLVGKDNAKSYLGVLNAQYKTVQDGVEVTLTGAEAMQVYSDALSGSTGAAEAMANIRLDNLSGDMERLTGAADALSIQLYQKAQPALRGMAQVGTAALETLAPVAVNVFGAIVDAVMSVSSAAMPGLIEAFNALQPALAGIVPAIAKFIGGFSVIASQAAAWGSKIIASLAQGMASAIAGIVSVLKYIGNVIRTWLQPNSPPKIVPELDQYGQDAGQLYVDSMANADVSGAMQNLGFAIEGELQAISSSDGIANAGEQIIQKFFEGMGEWNTGDFQIFNDISSIVEESLRALGESGALAKDAVVPAILESRDAVEEFVNSIKTTGYVSEEAMSTLIGALGPVSGEVASVVSAYGELYNATMRLAEANEAVIQAQEELNAISAEYDAKLSPLNDQLKALQAEEKRLDNEQKIAKLQEKIKSGKLDANELAQAQNELAQITLEQQIDAVEAEKELSVNAAEEKLKAAEQQQQLAEDAQKAAQAQYNAAQAQISASRENNSLLQEQLKILEEIKNAQSSGASGGGGGMALPDMGGGMPSLDDMEVANPFAAFESSISGVSESISQFQTDVNSGKEAITGFFTSFTQNPVIDAFGSSINNANTTLSTISSTINDTLAPPLTVLGDVFKDRIVPAIDSFGVKITEVFQEKGGPILDTFSEQWDKLVPIFERLKPAVEGLALAIGGGLFAGFTSILGIFEGGLEGSLVSLDGVLKTLGGTARLILEPITGLGTALGQLMSGDTEGAVETLRVTWENIKVAISDIVTGLKDTILGIFQSLLGSITGVWDNLYELMTGKASNISEQVTAFFDKLRTDPVAAVEELYNNAVDWFSSLYEEVVGVSVPETIEGIVERFSELPVKVVEFVQTLYNDVKKWFEDTKTNAITVFGEMTTEVITKVGELPGGVTTEVQKIITAITGMAGDFVTAAMDIGSAIIDGMTQGISKGLKSVVDAAKGVAQAALDAAKSALGIHSPSEVMADEVGEPITEGVAVGIANAKYAVEDALEAVKTSVTNKLVSLSDDAQYLFENVSDMFKGVADLINSYSSGTSAVQGLMPTRDDLKEGKKQYKELLQELADASVGIEDIDKDIAEKRKKIQEDLADAIKDTNKKIIDMQKDRAKIEEEIAKKTGETSQQQALQRQIVRLSASADPNDVLMQERIANLKSKYAEIEKENQLEVNDLLEKRTEIDLDLAQAQNDLVEKRLQLQQELQDAEKNADKDRQDALKKQLDILEELANTRQTYNRDKSLYNYLQSIAESTSKIFQDARVQMGELESLNPQTASKFFNEFQGGVSKLAKLEQDYLKESLNPDGADNQVINLLMEQIKLARKDLGVSLAGLKQGELESITKTLTDDTADTADQIRALDRQKQLIEGLDLAKLMPEWLNKGNTGSNINSEFDKLPELPQQLLDAVYNRRDQQVQGPDLNSLFSRLITAINGGGNTNYTVNQTAVNNGTNMSTEDYIRLLQLRG